MYYLFAMAQPPQSGQQGNPIAAFMPLILIFVIFYFLLIRPQQKKQKELQKMLSEIEKGNKVITSGGIHGIVANVKDDIISVKVAENVKIDVSRSCIAVVKKDKEEGTQA
jgi:preprotein translocase subunit YajC